MEPQIQLAKLLVKHSFGDRVFLCNSGTEAIEAAIKFARKWASRENPKKYNILSFTDGFHGRTYGGLSATAQKKFHQGFTPCVPGFYASRFNDIAHTRKMLDKRPYAGVIVEPIQGESGINAAGPEFLRFLREYTREHGIALIFDEIQCGVGRTGTLWHYEQHGILPDIMTVAKPIGGGLPLGAAVCTREIASAIAPGDHGTTFGGNPLACALGSVVLDTVAKKSFLGSVRDRGRYLRTRLEETTAGTPAVARVLGVGLMCGVRLTTDPAPVIAACGREGLLLIKAGNNTVRFMPPLTVSDREIDRAVAIFGRVLKG
jgi:acetylornithine/succinyldiaminopimelate/putrescine aminotransferase